MLEIYTPTAQPSTRVPKRPNEELRDYFAGQALAGMHARGIDNIVPSGTKDWDAHIAADAYRAADAMLKEREK